MHLGQVALDCRGGKLPGRDRLILASRSNAVILVPYLTEHTLQGFHFLVRRLFLYPEPWHLEQLGSAGTLWKLVGIPKVFVPMFCIIPELVPASPLPVPTSPVPAIPVPIIGTFEVVVVVV